MIKKKMFNSFQLILSKKDSPFKLNRYENKKITFIFNSWFT